MIMNSGLLTLNQVNGHILPGGGGGALNFMSDLFSEAIAEFDFADADCYPGSGQVVSNLIASPYDGSAQTAYDYVLGSAEGNTTSDPTFNTNKFTLAANDFFTLRNSVANAAWLNKHINTDGSINGGTMLFVVSMPASLTGNWHAYAGSSWSGTDYGLMLSNDADSLRAWVALAGSGSVSDFGTSANGEGLVNKIVGYTWDSNQTTNNFKAVAGAAAWQATNSVNFGDTSAKSISGQSGSHGIGTSMAAGTPNANTDIGASGDVDMFYVAYLDKFMSDDDLAAAVSYIEGRTGLTIT